MFLSKTVSKNRELAALVLSFAGAKLQVVDEYKSKELALNLS